MIEIKHHIPNYPLSEYIQYMVYVCGDLPIPYIKELPEGGINIVFELNENTSNFFFQNSNLESKTPLRKTWITGNQKQAIVYKNIQHWKVISIRFSVGGFSLLTGIPISEIEAIGQDPATLLGNSFDRLYHRVLMEPDIKRKFTLIESYFSTFRMQERLNKEVLHFFVKHIDKDLNWLVYKSGYSQKHFINLFRKHTGFSPKYLQRINRFNLLVRSIHNQHDSIDWFSIIQRFGYYDQSHLIKDFRHFAGETPQEYVNNQVLLKAKKDVPATLWQLKGAL